MYFVMVQGAWLVGSLLMEKILAMLKNSNSFKTWNTSVIKGGMEVVRHLKKGWPQTPVVITNVILKTRIFKHLFNQSYRFYSCEFPLGMDTHMHIP